MAYHIFQTKPLRRVFRWAYFPYMVFDGDYPSGRVVGVTDTVRGARTLIRKDKERRAMAPYNVGPVYGMKEVERA